MSDPGSRRHPPRGALCRRGDARILIYAGMSVIRVHAWRAYDATSLNNPILVEFRDAGGAAPDRS